MSRLSEILGRTGLDQWENDPDIELLEADINEYIADLALEMVEPCEPECSPERHAYHQGQWDMAQRIRERVGVKL